MHFRILLRLLDIYRFQILRFKSLKSRVQSVISSRRKEKQRKTNDLSERLQVQLPKKLKTKQMES